MQYVFLVVLKGTDGLVDLGVEVRIVFKYFLRK